MLCRNCGAENPNNNKFCVQCGAKLQIEQASVNQQRVISDKHYSLEDISKQQNESELKSSGVNLTKNSSSNDTQQPSSDSQYVGAVTGEPYKLKSAGFADEKEPVKRPSITDFANVPEQTNNNTYNSNGTQPQNNNTFGSNGTQPQNNNYSFGGAQPQNNNTFGSNGTQPQNNNYSFGGAQPQNNNTFGSNGASQYNGFSANNPNGAYSPTAVQSSQKNSNVAKIMIIVAVIIGVVLIGAIIFMVASGRYTGEPENSTVSDVPSVSSVPGTSSVPSDPSTSSVPSVSGSTGSSGELSGNTDFSNVVYSNLANMSLATCDDSGNVYYSDDNSYIQKQDPTGKKTEIYDGWSSCLNYYNDRLYFISSVSGYKTVCSVKTDGSDFKTHTNHKDVSVLVVSDGYAYYAINHYGSSSDSGAVFRVNLSSGSVDNLLVAENAGILAIFDYGDNVYVHYMDVDTYIGSLKRINKNNLSDTEEINSSTNEYDYYSVTIANDKFYFVTYEKNLETYSYDYVIYSMNLDGSNGQRIGGTSCEMISVYGDYIYYTMDKYEGSEYPLYRMKLDGTDNTLIYEENVSYMSIVGDKIYYLDSDADEMRVMNLDGSGNQVLK